MNQLWMLFQAGRGIPKTNWSLIIEEKSMPCLETHRCVKETVCDTVEPHLMTTL